jgi:hypothetical protein
LDQPAEALVPVQRTCKNNIVEKYKNILISNIENKNKYIWYHLGPQT